jgi:hypothetical protein
MTFFVVLFLILGLAAGAYMLRGFLEQQRHQRVRDQARLRVIENQLAGLRAAQRIRAAEHAARQRLRRLSVLPDPLTNSTLHEEPEEWR